MLNFTRLSSWLTGSILAIVFGTPSGLVAQEAEATPASHIVTVPQARVKLIAEAMLASDQPGVIALVMPTEGDRVEAGQLLVSLKADIAKAQLAIAEKEASTDVNLRFAKAQLKVAQAELDKAEYANSRGVGVVVPEVEVDRLRFTRDRAVLQIEQAEHESGLNTLRVDEAEARVDAAEIRAPFDGFVSGVIKRVGEAVRQGDPIIELKATDRVKVEGYVSVAQARRLRRGMPVKVWLDGYDAKSFEGTLHFVDVTASPVTGGVRVWAEVPNPDNELLGGLSARMEIELPADSPPIPEPQKKQTI